MSEETNKTEIPATISFFVSGASVSIHFADGLHEIPQHIVNYLGHTTLETLAPVLCEKTYADFIEGFTLKLQKDTLDKLQKRLIANHFEGIILTYFR